MRTKTEAADHAGTVSQKADSAALRTLLERVAQQAAKLSAVVANALEFERRKAQPAPQAPPDHSDPRRRLTPRECEVLDLVVEGRSSKEIARSLGITRATARCHVQNVLTKLGVASRIHAAALAAAPVPALTAPTPMHAPTPNLTTTATLALTPAPAPAPAHRKLQKLTARETEVLRALAAGLDRREIAAQLYLSPHTVRTHVQRVLAKLDVHSALSALALARSAGLQPLEIRQAPRPQLQASRRRETKPARPSPTRTPEAHSMPRSSPTRPQLIRPASLTPHPQPMRPSNLNHPPSNHSRPPPHATPSSPHPQTSLTHPQLIPPLAANSPDASTWLAPIHPLPTSAP